MEKRGFFLLALLWAFANSAHADWYSFNGRGEQAASLNVIEATEHSTVIEMKLSGFNYDEVKVNDQSLLKISIPQAQQISTAGAPDLPQISKNIILPWNSRPQLKVISVDSETLHLGPLAPSKGSFTRNINPMNVPFQFGNVYQSGLNFPQSQIKIGSVFTLRDVQGVGFTIYPVQYNAKTQNINVIKSIRFEVVNNVQGFVRMFQMPTKIDEGFNSLYENHFFNYQKLKTFGVRDVQHPVIDTGKLLIISHKNFFESMKPFVRWKLERGFDVKSVSLDEVGIGWNAIKNYIQKEYDINKISYVILVGDAEFIPFHPGKTGNASGNEADPIYALVAGNDTYPDLFISRMSVKNTADVENIISRTINYEKAPLDSDWYSKGTGIASDEGSWSGLKDWQRADLLRAMMLNWHYMGVDQHYDPSLVKSNLIRDLNEGRGYINYIGHGSQTSWGTSGFSNSDIERLTNSDRLPFIVSVACVNGDFNYSGGDSFAEKWLKAGTAANPKGAVAVFASSTNQAWIEPTVGQKTITELLTADKLNTVGSLFFHGAVSVLESNMAEAVQTFETWHIFGDATLQVRTIRPTAIGYKLSRNEESSEAADEVSISVDDDRVSGAVFLGEQQIGRGYVECCGKLTIKLNQEVQKGTDLRLVLSGFNKIPTEVMYVKK